MSNLRKVSLTLYPHVKFIFSNQQHYLYVVQDLCLFYALLDFEKIQATAFNDLLSFSQIIFPNSYNEKQFLFGFPLLISPPPLLFILLEVVKTFTLLVFSQGFDFPSTRILIYFMLYLIMKKSKL